MHVRIFAIVKDTVDPNSRITLIFASIRKPCYTSSVSEVSPKKLAQMYRVGWLDTIDAVNAFTMKRK